MVSTVFVLDCDEDSISVVTGLSLT